MFPDIAIKDLKPDYYDYSIEQKAEVLSRLALEAANKAYAPYSHFKVGAALVLENGKLIGGSNQEVAAYPSGLCAERVALFAKFHAYGSAHFEMIAIAARQEKPIVTGPVQPCGACLEVMAEQYRRTGKDFWVALNPPNKVEPVLKWFSELLPGVFKF